MIQGITTKTVRCIKIICPLGCHEDFVEGKGALIKNYIDFRYVSSDLYCLRHCNIAQTRNLDHPFTWLDIVESESSVYICDCPKIIFSDSHCRAWHRSLCSGLHNSTAHIITPRSGTRNKRNQHAKQRYQNKFSHNHTNIRNFKEYFSPLFCRKIPLG